MVRFTRVEIKEKILRAAREKGQVTHKGKPVRLTADLSAETLQTRREWKSIFISSKKKNFQPRISYPAKLSFIKEGKIKFFTNKQTQTISSLPGLLYKSFWKKYYTQKGTTSISHPKNLPKGKEYLHNEESVTTNGQNSQLALNDNVKLTNININPKFKWIKHPNQRHRQANWIKSTDQYAESRSTS